MLSASLLKVDSSVIVPVHGKLGETVNSEAAEGCTYIILPWWPLADKNSNNAGVNRTGFVPLLREFEQGQGHCDEWFSISVVPSQRQSKGGDATRCASYPLTR